MVASKQWSGKVGFLFSAVSSAIGLANIWKFPYLVGQYGGGAFVALYLLFLLLLGFPLLLSEVALGFVSQKGVHRAYSRLLEEESSEGARAFWTPIVDVMGKFVLLTGFFVGCYYACVAGWFVGYSVFALTGTLNHLESAQEARALFAYLTTSPLVSFLCALLFFLTCIAIVARGVQGGIERASRLLVPLLLAILALMCLWVYFSLDAQLFHPLFSWDPSKITSGAVLEAMGHAFFTLSLGQGTMIAYGSYLPSQGARSLPMSITSTTALVALCDTLVSLLSAYSILGFCQIVGMSVSAGPSLVFETLPLLFQALPVGLLFSLLFFALLLMATITSQISVMQPVIAYLEFRGGLKAPHAIRRYAGAALILIALICLEGGEARILPLPLLSFFDLLCTSIMIPLGGLITAFFCAVILGYRTVRSMLFPPLTPNAASKEEQVQAPLAGAWGLISPLRELIYSFVTICCIVIAPLCLLFVFVQAFASLWMG